MPIGDRGVIGVTIERKTMNVHKWLEDFLFGIFFGIGFIVSQHVLDAIIKLLGH